MAAANTPVPVLLERNTTVRQPVGLPGPAEMTSPSKALPVHVPSTGAEVLSPSWMVMKSMGAAPAVLRLKVMKFSDMAPPAWSGQRV